MSSGIVAKLDKLRQIWYNTRLMVIDDEVKLALEKLEDGFNGLSRRVDGLQKSVNLLSEDTNNSNILEDLLGGIRTLEATLLASRRHQDLKTQDIKADIKEVHDKIEKTASETQETVQENVGALATEISSKKIIVRKEVLGIIGRFKKLFKRK